MIFSVAWNTIFTDYWKVIVLTIRRWKNGFFWAKKLIERWYLLITGNFLFWSLRSWEIRSVFGPKSWWKDDIYWLLKSSCLNFSEMRNTVFFWVKKLTERWYLLGLFGLTMIFQGLGNMVFRSVKRISFCKEVSILFCIKF